MRAPLFARHLLADPVPEHAIASSPLLIVGVIVQDNEIVYPRAVRGCPVLGEIRLICVLMDKLRPPQTKRWRHCFGQDVPSAIIGQPVTEVLRAQGGRTKSCARQMRRLVAHSREQRLVRNKMLMATDIDASIKQHCVLHVKRDCRPMCNRRHQHGSDHLLHLKRGYRAGYSLNLTWKKDYRAKCLGGLRAEDFAMVRDGLQRIVA